MLKETIKSFIFVVIVATICAFFHSEILQVTDRLLSFDTLLSEFVAAHCYVMGMVGEAMYVAVITLNVSDLLIFVAFLALISFVSASIEINGQKAKKTIQEI